MAVVVDDVPVGASPIGLFVGEQYSNFAGNWYGLGKIFMRRC